MLCMDDVQYNINYIFYQDEFSTGESQTKKYHT